MKNIIRLLFLSILLTKSSAFAASYDLVVARKEVNIIGKPTKAITINGTIPGPTLRFTEGEEVTINVTNHLDKPTAIHWHGLILPGNMDGVPDFNGFPGILPDKTFTYHFKVNQSGTYWYHSHFDAQEQEGLYGSIVITPKAQEPLHTEHDYVVVLSDFTEENPHTILNNLKMNDSYYNYHQRTAGDFLKEIKNKGLSSAWQDSKMWGQMRMSPTDLSDVSGYHFLINGRIPEQNWTGIFKKGEKIRLRFINAAAMSIYDLRIPGLNMSVVAADGQRIEPVPVDELRIGNAETYDVVVEPNQEKAYTIVAEPIDRTGFALATLAPREGMKGEIPKHRPRATLTMSDMGDMEGMDMTQMMQDMPDMDMSSGWAKAGTPEGHKALDYKDLRFLGSQKDNRAPIRDIAITLGGNMQRYIWTINGQKFMDSQPIHLKYGERVRLKFTNDTMMAHPMHLHGMFVQLENGQPMDKLPNKHTVIIPPGKTVSVLLTADQKGEWAFHCHMLYHMLAGMMTKVIVAEATTANAIPETSIAETSGSTSHFIGGHHHAH